jgi:hypothetical protein
MKSNVTRTVLEAVLITSLLLSVWFFIRFFNQSHEARGFSTQIQQAVFQSQNNARMFNLLVADCQEYGKTHSDMARLLESLKSSPPAASTERTAPAAAKPPAK